MTGELPAGKGQLATRSLSRFSFLWNSCSPSFGAHHGGLLFLQISDLSANKSFFPWFSEPDMRRRLSMWLHARENTRDISTVRPEKVNSSALQGLSWERCVS